uniref:NADH dehydrogenase subunit 6 n=1 Tax=Cerion uva TaxID=1108933 RepID=A0A343AZV9_9EUPU|nr:NADH dehydrogenase subunit 6 [Cerion uva]AQL10426.1 NADH dehydrogenase subunit 6 [Cerion uva]
MAVSLLYLLSILSLMLTTSLSAIQLTMVLWALSVLYCVMISATLSSWICYLLFLVYIGGILILFMFLIFLSTNQLMKITRNSMIYIFVVSSVLMPLCFMVEDSLKNSLGVAQGYFLGFNFSVWGLHLGVVLLMGFLGMSEALVSKGRVVKVSYDI